MSEASGPGLTRYFFVRPLLVFFPQPLGSRWPEEPSNWGESSRKVAQKFPKKGAMGHGFFFFGPEKHLTKSGEFCDFHPPARTWKLWSANWRRKRWSRNSNLPSGRCALCASHWSHEASIYHDVSEDIEYIINYDVWYDYIINYIIHYIHINLIIYISSLQNIQWDEVARWWWLEATQ